MDPSTAQPGEIEASQFDPKHSLEKLYYRVFPKDEINTTKAVNSIKQIVGGEDIHPWSAAEDIPKNWIVEASPEEVSKLKADASIDHVEEFCPPKVPVAKQSHYDKRLIGWLAARDPTAPKSYMVFAKDGKDESQTDATEVFLQILVGKQNVKPPFIHKDEIRYWLCNMSTTQRTEASRNAGVVAVEANQKGGFGSY